MALPNFNNYKYILFVDASGDDGYKFRKNSNDGSSFSFVVSCFVTEPTDLAYNKNILLEMKQALFIKPEQEIKSTALKRHRNSNSVYNLFPKLKGFAYTFIADKKLIKDSTPDNTKEFRELSIIAQNDLSGITHTYPIVALGVSGYVKENDKVLIVIDNMKKREMNSIRSLLKSSPPFQYDLAFRDSKDKDFALIQIADIMAGTIRNYYENCLPISAHNRYCGLCIMAAKNNRPNRSLAKCLDKKFRKNYLPYLKDTHFNTVVGLHNTDDSETVIGDHLVILPFEQLLMFTYIECLIMQHPLPIR